jgi:hypothetical protein
MVIYMDYRLPPVAENVRLMLPDLAPNHHHCHIRKRNMDGLSRFGLVWVYPCNTAAQIQYFNSLAIQQAA